jgi:hypothetical protein
MMAARSLRAPRLPCPRSKGHLENVARVSPRRPSRSSNDWRLRMPKETWEWVEWQEKLVWVGSGKRVHGIRLRGEGQPKWIPSNDCPDYRISSVSSGRLGTWRVNRGRFQAHVPNAFQFCMGSSVFSRICPGEKDGKRRQFMGRRERRDQFLYQ